MTEDKVRELATDSEFLDDICHECIIQGNKYQISSCKAWYVPDDEYNCMWIVSYETVVACYDCESHILYSFGRFSRTTYYHIRNFKNNYTSDMYNTKEVNLGIINNWNCYG